MHAPFRQQQDVMGQFAVSHYNQMKLMWLDHRLFTTGVLETSQSDDSIDVGGVEVLDQKSNEAHLFARVIKHDLWVIRVAA